MRVLMFGWEFPPQISGGLGVACEGLVRGLLQSGTEVVLVLPRHPYRKPMGRLRILESLATDLAAPAPPRPRAPAKVRFISTRVIPYPDSGVETVANPIEDGPAEIEVPNYGPNLATDVLRYAERAGAIARRERFDVIHAHDWMTFLAGLEARRVSGKPLVLHVHATESDRAGAGGNAFVRDIERAGRQRRGPRRSPSRATRPGGSDATTACPAAGSASCTTPSTRARGPGRRPPRNSNRWFSSPVA